MKTELIDGDDIFLEQLLAVKCTVVLSPSLLLNCPLSKALVQRKILGDQIFENFALFSPQSDPNIRLVCYCMWRTTSFLNQVQRKTNDREDIFERILQPFLNYFHIILHFLFESHTMSVNIDIEMILPLRSAGSHCNPSIIF